VQAEIERSVRALYRDFCLVQADFFDATNSIAALMRRVVKCQSGENPSAGINAIALSTVSDGKIPTKQLRSYLDLYPSPVTTRFLEVIEGMLLPKLANE
jgi:hypothetical protein